MTVEELNDKIVAQGNKVRDLKAAKADKAAVKAEVDALLALKTEFKAAFGSEWKPGDHWIILDLWQYIRI